MPVLCYIVFAVSSTLFACESINRNWIDGLIIRWKTADDFVARLDSREGAQLVALRRILRRDLPTLIQEVTRLRPELALPDDD
jgi:hypothetical protein